MTDDDKCTARKLSDSLARFQGEADDIARMAKQLQAIDGSARFRRAVDEINRQDELLNAVMRPALASWDFQALSLADPLAAYRQKMADVQKSLPAVHERFRLPLLTEVETLTQQFTLEQSAVSRQLFSANDSLRAAMEAMRTPWLDTFNEMRSIGSLAALQGLGQSLRELPTFGERVTELARADLGDWRDRMSIPSSVVDDPALRRTFYVERGFNLGLADFPPPAFIECLAFIDLRGEAIDPVTSEQLEEGIDFAKHAFARLRRFERALRQFIDEIMIKACGPDWPTHRLPNNMHEAWHQKRETAARNGAAPGALIDYADFTDYERVICKTDNWPLFAGVFLRPENVRESLQRLAPIRLCTMHARIVTQDDLVFLYCETLRIHKAIGR